MSALYSLQEVATAADVPRDLVDQLVESEQVLVVDGHVREADAVLLVRTLRTLPGARAPLSPLPHHRRRGGLPLVASGALHVAFVLVIILASSLGLLKATNTEQTVEKKEPVRMVYLMTPGPGGGGGGGGLKMPTPPTRSLVKAPAPRRVSSPVPRPRPYRPPPRPTPIDIPPPQRPRPEPPPVQAPVVPDPGDIQDAVGVVEAPPSPVTPSAGPGSGGGSGTGAGTGMGEGVGSGIGPGSGGGTGGGPYRPGSGIEPPQLLREVRPAYTDEARRRAIEGDVVLEIVVRSDGTVGDVRVLRALGAGLDQRATAAIRQWRFSPARRQGAAVDVIVEVAVGFSLR